MKNKKVKFSVYYSEYKNKIYTYLWYRVGFNESTAEDLTSEVFIKALKNFHTFDQYKSFQSWIYMIAKNHLINHYSKSGREVELDQANDKMVDERDAFDNKQKVIEIIGKINNLKKYHKDVLLMRFVDELDNNEIAEILNKDEGAVRTQISRALTELRKEI
ncbi:hypothetical protein C0584_02020 [Candidatus Parcubacteria bacterium]|nr:MAG: hypothetical protein C0584_02020 [Candidatus Parcubacteria bacterium]